METTFPPALVDKINFMNEPGIQAELATVGEVRMAEPSPYHVIVDRISHDIPFYRGYLKNAALSGTIVINNPFWWSADDKFFNFALGEQAGRGDSQDGAAAAQAASAGNHRPLHAQPAVPAAVGQHLQLRRISRRFSSPSTAVDGRTCTRSTRRRSSSTPTTRAATSA